MLGDMIDPADSEGQSLILSRRGVLLSSLPLVAGCMRQSADSDKDGVPDKEDEFPDNSDLQEELFDWPIRGEDNQWLIDIPLDDLGLLLKIELEVISGPPVLIEVFTHSESKDEDPKPFFKSGPTNEFSKVLQLSDYINENKTPKILLVIDTKNDERTSLEGRCSLMT